MTVQLRENAAQIVRHARPVGGTAMLRGGLTRGTIVLTARGETPVEDLRPGDRIVTRERGIAVLRAIGRTTGPACSVRTDSLGLARPDRDVVVAADQHVAVRDWRAEALFEAEAALVPADRLVDGRHIARRGEAALYQLDLGAPLTIYANGLEVPTGRTEDGILEIEDAS